MDDIIRSMISGYTDAFDAYPISGENLRLEVIEFKRKMTAFAESNNDITTFHQRLSQSGLQEEYMQLITKAVMASSGSANEEGEVKTDYSDHETPQTTVKEFVEQYRSAYNSVKSAGYRTRAEAAYEAIFDVANCTDDMLEAQLIFEKERLLWNISAQDALDIFEPVLEAMDPLQPSTSATLKLQIAAYKKATSEEELISLIEKNEYPKIIILQHEISKITIAALLSFLLFEYCSSKQDVWEWRKDIQAQAGVSGIVSLKKAIRRVLNFLKEDWGISYTELFNDESIKIWLLLPAPADTLGRIKTSLTPKNLTAFREIIETEILPDISVTEILTRIAESEIYFNFGLQQQDLYNKKSEEKAKALNADLTYYKYAAQFDFKYQELQSPLNK